MSVSVMVHAGWVVGPGTSGMCWLPDTSDDAVNGAKTLVVTLVVTAKFQLAFIAANIGLDTCSEILTDQTLQKYGTKQSTSFALCTAPQIAYFVLTTPISAAVAAPMRCHTNDSTVIMPP